MKIERRKFGWWIAVALLAALAIDIALTTVDAFDLQKATQVVWFLLAAGLIGIMIPGLIRVLQTEERDPGEVCMNCGYDLRASADRCPECNTPVPRLEDDRLSFPLRDDWPATPIKPREPQEFEQPATVHETSNTVEADLLRQQLMARGIWSGVEEMRDRSMQSRYDVPPVSSKSQIRVWSGDEEDARAIVAKLLTSTLKAGPRRIARR